MPPEEHHLIRYKTLYFLLFILLVVFFGAAYYIFFYLAENTTNAVSQDRSPVADVQTFSPEGKIYLTLSPLDANFTGIYSFDLVKGELTKIFGQDNTGSLTSHLFGTGTDTILFSSNLSLDHEEQKQSLLQIFTLDDQGLLKQLTTSSSVSKRHPSYSEPLNMLIYSAKSNADVVGMKPTDFGVYKQGVDGKESLVGEGALPTLTPDGKSVVVLRKDGLYLVNLSTKEDIKIWGLDHGDSALNLQFAVSPSGQYIAWSIPDDGHIFIMKVDSWNPFKGAVTSQIDTHAFWPVFSPDEKYLAYEEVDWIPPEPINQRLAVFSLKTKEKRIVKDLKDFNQLRLFISEWR